ncbi:hypothetical protein ACQEU1_45200 [Lentzea sp. CA-135723]
MAGHRTSRAERVRALRTRFHHRVATSRGDLDRLAAAVDYLRTALARTPEEQRDPVVTAVVADLVVQAEALLTRYQEGPRR